MPASDRNKVSVALSQHAQDLSDGVTILVSSNLPGPALALARPLVEAYTRSIWIHKCASESDIDELVKNETTKRRWPGLKSMSKSLNDHAPDESAWVSFVITGLDALHDLTHGGRLQILNRITESSIEPYYSDEDIATLLCYAIEGQIRSACLLIEVLNDSDLMEEFRRYLSGLERPPLTF